MNIQVLSPANEISGYCFETGKTETIITSVRLPSMDSVRDDRQIAGGGYGLRLRIDTLKALGMTDTQITKALEA